MCNHLYHIKEKQQAKFLFPSPKILYLKIYRFILSYTLVSYCIFFSSFPLFLMNCNPLACPNIVITICRLMEHYVSYNMKYQLNKSENNAKINNRDIYKKG